MGSIFSENTIISERKVSDVSGPTWERDKVYLSNLHTVWTEAKHSWNTSVELSELKLVSIFLRDFYFV